MFDCSLNTSHVWGLAIVGPQLVISIYTLSLKMLYTVSVPPKKNAMRKMMQNHRTLGGSRECSDDQIRVHRPIFRRTQIISLLISPRPIVYNLQYILTTLNTWWLSSMWNICIVYICVCVYIYSFIHSICMFVYIIISYITIPFPILGLHVELRLCCAQQPLQQRFHFGRRKVVQQDLRRQRRAAMAVGGPSKWWFNGILFQSI